MKNTMKKSDALDASDASNDKPDTQQLEVTTYDDVFGEITDDGPNFRNVSRSIHQVVHYNC
jgi:hypothetical protein